MKFMINKIIIGIIITSMLAIAVPAMANDGSAVIVSPANGQRINSQEATASIHLAQGITDAALYIDGELLQDIDIGDGVGEYDIPFTPKSLGSHRMMVIAKGENGIVSDVSEFVVYEKVQQTVKDYGFDATSSLEYYIAQSLGGGVAGFSKRSLTSGTDGSGRWIIVSFKERDGGNDPVFIRYAGSEKLTGEVSLYLRIKAMQTNESFFVRLEGIGDITVLDKTGKLGTTDAEYEADKWYDVKICINTAVGTCETYVEDILADSRDAGSGGYSAVRLYMSGNNNDNAQYMLDTFRIDRTGYTPSVTKIVSVTGDAESEEISASSDKIRLYFDSMPSATAADAENVKLTTETDEITLTAVSSNKNEKYIEISADSLKENTDYKVHIDLGAFYPDGEYETALVSSLRTAAGGFAVQNMGFESGETPLLTAKFVNSGDKINAKADFVNKTDGDKTVTVIISSYTGNRINAVCAKSASIPSGTASPITVRTGEIAYPGGEAYYVRASIINSWEAPYAIASPIDLG